MSWQAYVDSNLVGSEKVSSAAIFGHDGSQWATSAAFALTADEINTIVAAFKDAAKIRSSGVYANGTKYLTLRADDRSIYGRQKNDGIVCVKTKQAVLVAVYTEPMIAGEAVTTVEALADYLINSGY